MAGDVDQVILYRNYNSSDNTCIDVNGTSLPFINNIIDYSGNHTFDWTRSGYNFIEWNTSSDGTGDNYLPGDFCTRGTLYAIWEEIPIVQKQPVLTYNLTWGTGNIFQKLSGKTYVNPSGQTVDCSTLTVTFSSSQHFKKFYATAVKSGNDYGFENDILVDIRQTNPTGVLLYELTERNANVNFSFTINTSSLTSGDGEYRIGLYIQNDDGIWNYEYFLVDVNNNPIVDSQGNNLQVPVQNQWEYNENNNEIVIRQLISDYNPYNNYEPTTEDFELVNSFYTYLSNNFDDLNNLGIGDVYSVGLFLIEGDLNNNQYKTTFSCEGDTVFEPGEVVYIVIFYKNNDSFTIGDYVEYIFSDYSSLAIVEEITLSPENLSSDNKFICCIAAYQ